MLIIGDGQSKYVNGGIVQHFLKTLVSVDTLGFGRCIAFRLDIIDAGQMDFRYFLKALGMPASHTAVADHNYVNDSAHKDNLLI